ncbi:MAG: BrnT family toxin [Steroidobacteraceae bacterium]
MSSLRFEWDEKKGTANRRKHGVSFDEARTAFLDENARVIPDPEHSSDEERFVLIGLSISARVLVVCHCYRYNDEVIRIISARKANHDEAEQYHWWVK